MELILSIVYVTLKVNVKNRRDWIKLNPYRRCHAAGDSTIIVYM